MPDGNHADALDRCVLFALGWLVLSLGAMSLLNVLIRQGSAVNVASLL